MPESLRINAIHPREGKVNEIKPELIQVLGMGKKGKIILFSGKLSPDTTFWYWKKPANVED